MITQENLSRTDMIYYEAKKRSTMTSYMLWFFLGWCGMHHFYLRNTTRGLLYLCLGPFAWVIYLVFGIGSMSAALTAPDVATSTSAGKAVGTVAIIVAIAWIIWFLLWIVDAFILHRTVDERNMILLNEIVQKEASK